MSRIERKQEEKNKKRARRAVYRLLFLWMMICILSISTFLIDKEATLMIGEINTYNIEVFVKNIGKSIFESYKDIEEKLSKLNIILNNRNLNCCINIYIIGDIL